jgi:hypothetical protein
VVHTVYVKHANLTLNLIKAFYRKPTPRGGEGERAEGHPMEIDNRSIPYVAMVLSQTLPHGYSNRMFTAIFCNVLYGKAACPFVYQNSMEPAE